MPSSTTAKVSGRSRRRDPSSRFAPSLDEICEDVVRAILCAYIGRLAVGESLKEINEELERRLLPRSGPAVE